MALRERHAIDRRVLLPGRRRRWHRQHVAWWGPARHVIMCVLSCRSVVCLQGRSSVWLHRRGCEVRSRLRGAPRNWLYLSRFFGWRLGR